MAAKKSARHELPQADWPTAAEAEASILFSPCKIGRHLRVPNRAWVPAMVPWRATPDGLVTQANIDWYGRFASGQPGVVVVEATGIRDIPSGPLLRLGHDRYIPGMKDLVAEVKRASNGETKVFIQLIDFLGIRRRPDVEKYFSRFLTLTDNHRTQLAQATDDDGWLTAADETLRQFLAQGDDQLHELILSERELESLRFGHRERVEDTHLDHIKDLPKVLPSLFADAAARAQEAGFDGVELHYAHAYTMASFLSRRNNRDDGYGGSPENRVRLPLEVFAAVRERVGDDYVVGCRFLGDDVIEGGSRIADAVSYAVAFAEAGMDFLSVSKGGKFEDAKQPRVGDAAYPYTGPSGQECMPTVRIDERGPFLRNVHLATEIKKAVLAKGFDLPIVTAGGVSTFGHAETILKEGHADFVGAARQSLADPDWWLKVKLGRGQETRRCEFTNYCEGLDQKHKEVTCRLWDKIDLDDPQVSLSEDGRRRLLPPAWE
ncbi:MAG: 2,4-dienoyl-CoA reductase-like NADH-dependent reductase (Old Yellow Enzyme family) [Planctomycetota bacterium]|jgi:2,4-dienoyl-CoA reductase-like NADH-dependent reductase (Old Yellow Enzyme family)